MPRSLVANVFLLAFAVLVVATVIGVVVLWPEDRTLEPAQQINAPKTERAEIVSLRNVPARHRARRSASGSVQLESGPKKGQRSSFGFAGRDVRFAIGDEIRVYEQKLPQGAQIGGVKLDPFQFSDFERGRPLVLLAAIFVALVFATAR